jgi:hypothetical protein
MTTHGKEIGCPDADKERRLYDAVQSAELFFIAVVVALGAAEYLKAAPCALSVIAIIASARWLELAIENEYEERGKNVTTYYDFGRLERGPRNAVKVAAADESGRVVHYYIGYVSNRENVVKLYPGETVRGSAHQPTKRTIRIDDLRSREQYRLLGEEISRRAATSI